MFNASIIGTHNNCCGQSPLYDYLGFIVMRVLDTTPNNNCCGRRLVGVQYYMIREVSITPGRREGGLRDQTINGIKKSYG